MSLIGGLPRPEIVDKNGKLLGPWAAWFSALNNLIRPLGGNGATTARPASNLYVGLMFFDTTLGYPVFIKSLNPTVWVNGAGSVV